MNFGNDAAATGELLHFHTARAWLEEWVEGKKGVTTERTNAKYQQIVTEFLEHAGERANKPLGAISPRDVRSTIAGPGRVVELAEALACDIVCIHVPLALAAKQLRRGTHVNVLAAITIDPELAQIAMVTHENPGLGALAAGLVDGRQLDEITIFIAT